MRDVYYIVPKGTIKKLGLEELAEQRRRNSDNTQVIFTRGDMLKVQPTTTTDEQEQEIIPEGYVRSGDIIIHSTVKVYRHEELLTLTRKGKWTNKTKK